MRKLRAESKLGRISTIREICREARVEKSIQVYRTGPRCVCPAPITFTLHYFTYVCLHTCDFCARQPRHRPLPVFERGGCNLSAFARADGRTGNGSGEDVCGMRVLRETWNGRLHVCLCGGCTRACVLKYSTILTLLYSACVRVGSV